MRLRLSFILTFLILTPSAAQAQDSDYRIDVLDVRLELREDGSYQVEETIAFDFSEGSFTQGVRSIPRRRIDRIRDVSVTSPDTDVVEVEHQRDGRDYLIVWTFPERTEPASFLLRYEVTGALVADGQENAIDWNAVGRAVEVPIRRLRVAILLPDFELSREEIRIEPVEEGVLEQLDDGWRVRFTHDDLPPKTAYRAVVGFPQRLEGRRPPAPAWYFLLGALGFLVAVIPGVSSYKRSRATRKRESADGAPEISIPEAAFLLTDSLSFAARAFSAVLFDLARRGHLTLRHNEQKRWHGTEEHLEVELHPRPAELSDFEQAFVGQLAKFDSFQDFTSKGWRFQYEAARRLRERLVARGLMVDDRPRSNRLFTVAAAGGLVGLAASLALTGWMTALALGVTGGAVVGTVVDASTRYPLTDEGTATKERAQAFVAGTRKGIEDAMETDPLEAARLLLAHLPWFFLDTKVTSEWLKRFEKAMEEAGAEIELPEWLKSTAGSHGLTNTALLLSTVAVMHTSSTFGGGGVGAGGIGGAGGGGVGAR